MNPVGFEPIISAGKRPQTYTLDRAATGTGPGNITVLKYHSDLTQWVNWNLLSLGTKLVNFVVYNTNVNIPIYHRILQISISSVAMQ
jgi:hypothetical protein